jgi:chorismate-pyruvate lyase
VGLAVLSLAGKALAWPDTADGRRAAWAEMRRFEEALDSADSATAVLRGWCASHHLAQSPEIRALRDTSADEPAGAAVRRMLRAAAGEAIRYRRVRLVCGDRVLSEADNWYRPAFLTDDMNRQLDTTDTPFGVVVRPLAFHRRTLDVRWLFQPLKGRPGRAAAAQLAIPREILRHRAVLVDAKGAPFSLVVETYTAEVLWPASPPPERGESVTESQS